MTTFRNSTPVERAFQWDKQWQHPGRREFIYGKVQDDLPKSNRLWLWMQAGVMIPCVVYAVSLWVVR